MEKKDNVIELKQKEAPTKTATPSLFSAEQNKTATNPIAKNFIKYVHSSKGKFSLKDIFR